jgi:uncharacterized delta-60 repeat protein
VSTIGPAAGAVYGALLQPDGNIVVAGASYDPAQLFCARSLRGRRQRRYGIRRQRRGLDRRLTVVRLGLFDGAAAGWQDLLAGDCGFQFCIARYESDGTVDASFGSGGVVLGGQPAYARALALQPDGRIVVAGDGDDGPGGGPTISTSSSAASTRTAAPTRASRAAAWQPPRSGQLDDFAAAVSLQPSGRIVVTGYTTTAHSSPRASPWCATRPTAASMRASAVAAS